MRAGRRLFPSRTRGVLRATNEANLPDECDRLVPKVVREPGGVTKTEHVEAEMGVPCYLAPATRLLQERVLGPQVEPAPRFMVRLPARQPVTYKSRLRVTVHESGEVVTVAVEGIEAPRSEETARIVVGVAV